MIVTKHVDGHTVFVALHLCPYSLPGKLWRPIRTEGDAHEASALDAIQLCVATLQAQVKPLVGQARALHRDCRMLVERPDAEAHARSIAISLMLSRELARLWGNLERLLDEPTAEDKVTLDVAAVPLLVSGSDDEGADSHTNTPTLTTNQLRAGRVLAGLGVRELASVAEISTTTISFIELGRTQSPQQVTLEALRDALEARSIEFAPGGWVRHVGNAIEAGSVPATCPRCAEARYLLDIVNRVIGQTRAILHGS